MAYDALTGTVVAAQRNSYAVKDYEGAQHGCAAYAPMPSSSSDNKETRDTQMLQSKSAEAQESEALVAGPTSARYSRRLIPGSPGSKDSCVHCFSGGETDVLAMAKDADAKGLIWELCGNVYIDASRLQAPEPLGQGAFATVKKCSLSASRQSAGGAKTTLHSCTEHFLRKLFTHKQLVAVKQLKPCVLSNEAELHGFIAETNVLRKLSHPAIVEFKGVGAMDTSSTDAMRRSMYLVQELMLGGTLKALLVDAYFSPPHKPRLYSRQDALRWALQIAQALEYLHHFSPMIVHRDLKLENILLTSPNPSRANAKLSDFGLCKCIKDVASGVPMAQSTAHLQSLLHDMGFAQRTPLPSVPSADLPLPSSNTQHSTTAGSSENIASPPRPFIEQQRHGIISTAVARPLCPAPPETAKGGASDGVPSSSSASADIHLRDTPHAPTVLTPASGTQIPPAGGHEASCTPWSSQGQQAVDTSSSLPPQLPSDSGSPCEGIGSPAEVGTVTCRRCSYPLAAHASPSEEMLQPALETQSMGSLGCHSISMFQPLPPLPRGSGVAQRLRSIRAASRDGEAGSAVDDEDVGPHINAEVAAKLRASRHGNSDGLASSLPSSTSAGRPSYRAFATASSHKKYGHSHLKVLLARILAKLPRSRKHSPIADRRACSRAGSSSDKEDVDSVSSPQEGTVRNGKLVVVSGGGCGGSQALQSSSSSRGADIMLAKRASSHLNSMLRAPLQRVSCGFNTGNVSDSVFDDSIHAADMVYRMTGTTGSLAYMAPEVLRGTFYSEKVDIFSLAVVMYELLSYTPTTALVTGEHMVDRMYHYAEEVASGFRQELPLTWPAEVRALISDCWAANPMLRPSAAKVAKRLQSMQDSGLLRQWDKADRNALRKRSQTDGLAKPNGSSCSCL